MATVSTAIAVVVLVRVAVVAPLDVDKNWIPCNWSAESSAVRKGTDLISKAVPACLGFAEAGFGLAVLAPFLRRPHPCSSILPVDGSAVISNRLCER